MRAWGWRQFARNLIGACEVAKPAAVPEGWKLVATKGLDGLVEALDRAQRKGYLPDAMADEWEAFEYRDAASKGNT
jgi:hypothetical protein